MTKQEILDVLKYFSKEFPRAAIREIQANREEFTAELLEALEYASLNAARLCEDENEYYLHMYAMFLLAEFKEKRAFPYLLALLQLPEDQTEYMIGDTLTEDFHRVLFCTYDGENIQTLLDIIENAELYEWSRMVAVKAYEWLYKGGFVTQEEFVLQLRSFIYDKLTPDDSDIVFTAFVGSVIDSQLTQMIPDVRYLYDNDRVDTFVHGQYDSVINHINSSEQPEMPTYIEDAISAMEWWACFNKNPNKSMVSANKILDDTIVNELNKFSLKAQPIVNKFEKTGRNDPCPCGSGKKFKKCCYGN